MIIKVNQSKVRFSMEFETIVKKKNGQFVVLIPKLSLCEQGDDLNVVYKILEEKKEILLKRMTELDLNEYIPKKNNDSLNLYLKTKLYKYLIGLTIFLIGFFIVKYSIESTLRKKFKNINETLLVELEKEIPLEVKEKRLEKFRSIFKNYSPYLAEIKSALLENSTEKAPANANKAK